MKNKLRPCFWTSLFLTCILFTMSCSSGFTTIGARPPENYQKLGKATGESCGTLIGGPTAYNAIPIGLNSRTERAYKNALDNVPGSTGLTDITLEENWIWWVIGSTRCVKISGEAIK